MRILMIHTSYEHGGAAVIARSLFNAINKTLGFECCFVYGRGKAPSEKLTWKFTFQFEIYFHGLLTRFFGIQGYGTLFSTFRLLRYIYKWRPDLVHFHNLHGYYLDLWIVKKVQKLGIPVVWTLHDPWPLTGRCAYFANCNRWKTGCGKCEFMQSYPKSYFDTSKLMWYKKRKLLEVEWKPLMVSPSRWLANLIMESSEGRCHVEVIPNGINTEIFRPMNKRDVRKKLGVPENYKIILFVGANLKNEKKGIRYFLESLDYLRTNDWLVLIIGKPIKFPEGFKHKGRVRQLGYIKNRETLAELYNAADLFCITSIDENFPTVVLESMSCGTPVVGFSVGGIPEQVSENCGVLVAPLNIEGLGTAIQNLLVNRDIADSMARNCREKVINEFNESLFIDRYMALYKSLF